MRKGVVVNSLDDMNAALLITKQRGSSMVLIMVTVHL